MRLYTSKQSSKFLYKVFLIQLESDVNLHPSYRRLFTLHLSCDQIYLQLASTGEFYIGFLIKVQLHVMVFTCRMNIRATQLYYPQRHSLNIYIYLLNLRSETAEAVGSWSIIHGLPRNEEKFDNALNSATRHNAQLDWFSNGHGDQFKPKIKFQNSVLLNLTKM